MSAELPAETGGQSTKSQPSSNVAKWVSWGGWAVALFAVLTLLAVAWRARRAPDTSAVILTSEPPPALSSAEIEVSLPEMKASQKIGAVSRQADLHTIIPNRPRQEIVRYEVDFGDSVFGIAQKYNIKPETVLWANYDLLNDNPDLLSPGMDLNIPPINGVYYQWQEGDSLEAIASAFEADVDAILTGLATALT